ncbi:transposase [Weissella cibaria]|nr:transposase [Weissella cibaria]
MRNPSQIWQWERVLESGRLKPDKRRWNRTMNKQEQEQDKLKKLEKETELLRIKVTYLEKLEILA